MNTYDLLPEVLLKDGDTVEILYFLGEHSIIRFDGQEEVISSDLIDDASLNDYVRRNNEKENYMG